MPNPEHLAILRQGVGRWNEWRRMYPKSVPDLSDADLNGADLRGANLVATKFSGTLLNGADLYRAKLMGALFDSQHIVPEGEILTVYYRECLHGTNFREALVGHTKFLNLDLSEAIGLDAVIHTSPSSLGIETIFLSDGRIPEAFMRGCGVPNVLIEYSRSLIRKPVQFFSCFICHSSKDKRFCERLYADLQAKGIRTWYFPEDAKWGEPVWGEIDRSIKIYDKLVVVCSEHSLQSGPVLREIERALNREDKEHKNILFPITLDSYIFDVWEHPRKADVLAKVVGAFRGWNRSASKYDKAFKKLLKALRAWG